MEYAGARTCWDRWQSPPCISCDSVSAAAEGGWAFSTCSAYVCSSSRLSVGRACAFPKEYAGALRVLESALKLSGCAACDAIQRQQLAQCPPAYPHRMHISPPRLSPIAARAGKHLLNEKSLDDLNFGRLRVSIIRFARYTLREFQAHAFGPSEIELPFTLSPYAFS